MKYYPFVSTVVGYLFILLIDEIDSSTIDKLTEDNNKDIETGSSEGMLVSLNRDTSYSVKSPI